MEKRGDEILKKIFSSETTEPISTKLCWNDPWVVPFQTCVRHFSRTQFWKGPPKDHSTKVWLQLAQWFLRRLIKMWNVDGRTKSDGNSSHGLKDGKFP
jgi:hypothetical protein